MKKVFALLIGIDEYPSPVPALKGCKKDVDLFEDYLRELPGVELHAMRLLDADATKDGIVAGFSAHLAGAGEEDVALFYYSGHGTVEQAHPVFWGTNPDRVLQCLVCYDGICKENGKEVYNLLSDKELRYLIGQVAQRAGHCLAIFDSCHSGRATRPGAGVRRRNFLPRTADGKEDARGLPPREWQDFIFSGEISIEDLQERGVTGSFPEGRHIQVAACLPEESAYEVDGQGVFTRNLIDVLRRTGGCITYYDLQSHVRHFIKNDYQQIPQFYVPSNYRDLVYHNFLDLSAPENERSDAQDILIKANVIHHPDRGWFLDLGYINGISNQAEMVDVFSARDPEIYRAKIGKITAGETEIIFLPSGTPDPHGKYQAVVTGFLSSPITVFVDDRTAEKEGLRMVGEMEGQLGKNVFLTERELSADYRLLVQDDRYVVAHGRQPEKPVVPPVQPVNIINTRQVISYLKHIAQWEYVKQLHNPNSSRFGQKAPLDLRIVKMSAASNHVVPIANGEAHLLYDRLPDGNWGGSVLISLHNRWRRKLYVSCLYLSSNFLVYERFLPQGVVSLDAFQSVPLAEGKPIGLGYEKEVEVFNHPYSVFYIKVIASTEFFDVSNLVQDSLPSPLQGPLRAGRTRQPTNPDASDWITQLYTVKIRNPNYRRTSSP